MLRPVGRPLADQEYGVWPPVALTVAVYAEPTTPFGRDGVVMPNGAKVARMGKEAAGLLVPATVRIMLYSPDGSAGTVKVNSYPVVPPWYVMFVSSDATTRPPIESEGAGGGRTAPNPSTNKTIDSPGAAGLASVTRVPSGWRPTPPLVSIVGEYGYKATETVLEIRPSFVTTTLAVPTGV